MTKQLPKRQEYTKKIGMTEVWIGPNVMNMLDYRRSARLMWANNKALLLWENVWRNYDDTGFSTRAIRLLVDWKLS